MTDPTDPITDAVYDMAVACQARIWKLEAKNAAMLEALSTMGTTIARLVELGDALADAAKKHRKLSTPAAWEAFCAAIDAWEER